jgi:hypothetical protein
MRSERLPLLPLRLLLLATILAACSETATTGPVDDGMAGLLGHTHTGAAPASAADRPTADQNRIYASIRAATAAYQDIERALADGFVRGSECVVSPAGGMGFHYINPGRIDGTLEVARPEALLYEPQKNGRLRLVAVEHIIVAALWQGDGTPMLGSRPFDDHTAPGSSGPPFPHYQLHSWIWKHNPAGMHTPYNPNVHCNYAEGF